MSDAPALRVTGLIAGHDGVPVVTGLDLTVGAGEVVALLGANGAGKTTTLLTVSGLIPMLGGSVEMDGVAVSSGRVLRRGRSRQVVELARSGLSHVPEDRSLFFDLTTRENILLGRRRTQAGEVTEDLDRVLGYFPGLASHLDQMAGSLSGGQQQMLALARAVISRPRLLLVDELSLGLAPIIVEQLLPVLRTIADTTGAGVLIVEQHVHLALSVSDRAYVLRRGRVTASGSADLLASRPDLVEAGYFGDGATSGDRAAFGA